MCPYVDKAMHLWYVRQVYGEVIEGGWGIHFQFSIVFEKLSI